MSTSLVVAAVIFVIAVAIISRGMRIVPQQHAWVVERFGRFHGVLSPGLNLILPLIDSVAYKFDLREVPIDVKEQVCITKDNTQITIDAIIFLQITEPKSAAYGTSNPISSVESLAQTIMRNDVGQKTLDEVLSSRTELNSSIVSELDKAATTWGIKVLRYEIRDVSPPREVVAAMEKQITAEREKRASIAKSEGDKMAAINISEGAKQAAILKAQGEKEAAILRADGEAIAIEKIANANQAALKKVGESLNDDQGIQAMNMKVAQDFISKWGDVAKTSNLVIVPTDMGDLSGTVASFLKIAEVAKS